MMRPLLALAGACVLLLGWVSVIAIEANGDPAGIVMSLADSAQRCHLPGLAARGYLTAAGWERNRLRTLDRTSPAGQALIRQIIATRMAAARLLLQSGYTEAAERIALEGARADFGDLQARELLLEVRLQGEQAEAARRELMLLLLKHEDPQLLCLLGSSLAQAGETEDAAACFQRALRLDAGHVPTLVALAELQSGRGDRENACQWLEKAASAANTGDERELVARERRRLSAGSSPVVEVAGAWWQAHHVSVLLALAYLLFLVSPALADALRRDGKATL